jgi:hypothetical protein
LLALCFVRVETIFKFFNILKREFQEFGDGFKFLISKFESLYVDNQQVISRSFTFWSCRNRLLENIPLTTNSLEAWHAGFNTRSSVRHPNIAKLINLLQKEEQKQNLKLANLKKGKIGKKQKNYKELINILRNEKNYSETEFLNSICEKINIKFDL